VIAASQGQNRCTFAINCVISDMGLSLSLKREQCSMFFHRAQCALASPFTRERVG
jgi:hypothetical protein